MPHHRRTRKYDAMTLMSASHGRISFCLGSIMPMISTIVMILAVVLSCTLSAGATAQAADAELPPGLQSVSIDFNDVDIHVFIKFISDLTKRNFVVDDKVRGKVTIISPGKITVAEAYQVFESVLEVYGFAAVPSGDIIKIVPSPDARTKSIKTRLEEESGDAHDGVVTQIIPLRYADPDEIKRLFTPLVSRNSVILAYQPTNTLIVTDVYSNIKRLINILKAIDITGVGQQIAIIPVEFADASKLVNLLNTIFKTTAKNSKTAKDITFVADERTNVIVVLASEGDVDNIRSLVKVLDKETPKGQARIHVYYLENASAEDLAQVLMDIPQKEGAAATQEGKPTAPVVSDKVRITADKATNSLIIMADQEDYVVLEDIIRKIDIPRAMVYIEALIMEVSVDKDFRLGTEWIIGGQTTYDGTDMIYGSGFSGGATGGDAGYTAVGSATNPLTGETVTLMPPGFSMGIFGEYLEISGITFPSIAAIIQAYKKDRDVRILSTPQILTTDNQEAKIYVGQNVPFQTTATASTTGTELYNSYEYRDVGKSLKITPQISKDRMVRLEMALEVTDLQSATDNRPTTLKRTVETTAIVKDGNTVVLGGLIDDKAGVTDYRVPCLGDIPLLGNLFRSRANSNSQSNLYIFLTPRVIQNPDEATRVSDAKRNEIENLQENRIKLYEKKPGPESSNSDPPSTSGRSETPAGGASGVAIENKGMSRQAAQASPGELPKRVSPEPTAFKSPTADKPAGSVGTTAPSTTTKTGGANGYTIQVTSVGNADAARQWVDELNALHYAAYAVRSQSGDTPRYHVRIGFFTTPDSAADVLETLKAHDYTPTLIEL